MELEEMINGLLRVEQKEWGSYLFGREPLKHKINSKQKEVMVEKAIKCGEEQAQSILGEMPNGSMKEIAEKLGLKIEYTSQKQGSDRMILALFNPPNHIQVMDEPIKRGMKYLEIQQKFSANQMESLILGHEIFHALEYKDPKLYTQTETVALWKCLGYTHRVQIRILSEIGAMAFTKAINNSKYSPGLLDLLLYYDYQKESAQRLYKQVLKETVPNI